MWRATLSREAWMPIWGLSTESDFASPPPDGGKAGEPNKAAEMLKRPRDGVGHVVGRNRCAASRGTSLLALVV